MGDLTPKERMHLSEQIITEIRVDLMVKGRKVPEELLNRLAMCIISQ
jgi:hypothetical protein